MTMVTIYCEKALYCTTIGTGKSVKEQKTDHQPLDTPFIGGERTLKNGQRVIRFDVIRKGRVFINLARVLGRVISSCAFDVN